ncbi:MAG TPA: murein biosynthesis integral membrane protein MurJ [Terriglobales bacterium]|nr:murein biosynthesis integral membrane protein MurJ [Terriglobales bacterium]
MGRWKKRASLGATATSLRRRIMPATSAGTLATGSRVESPLMQAAPTPSGAPEPTQKSVLQRFLRLFRPSHQHTAFSATVLLAATILLSRMVGFLREIYVAWAFGATSITDAYNAGFQIPDLVNYFAAGGTASITFISIYTRFLAQKREEDARKTFSVIVTIMSLVLIAGIALGEIFAPQLNRLMFGKMPAAEFELCVHICRILLPAQLFFYIGGVASAVLLARRMFFLPAIGPLFYSGGIILGGLLFSRYLGISSMAYGGVTGCFLGIFLVNVIGAAKAGIGFRISFDIHNPAFREWIRLSVPLMLGVSLVATDEWIQRHFAVKFTGDITRLTYARRFFQAPIAVLGQAVGQASLPFFARLFGEKRFSEFSATVNSSIYRFGSAAILVSSFMMSAALPLIDLLYRRGHLTFSDSQVTSVFFFWFSLSLVFWAVQGLYARAFYAAGNTLTPMIASTIIVLASLPMYAALFRNFSTVGLIAASDIGIAVNCSVIAILLHRRGLVTLAGLPWTEIGKTGFTAVAAGIVAIKVGTFIPLRGSRFDDLKSLAVTTIVWVAVVALGLWLLKSKLPSDLRRRKDAQLSPSAAGNLPSE